MKADTRHRQVDSADEAKFTEIYRRYGRQVHAYCARRTGASEAADAVAETFLVVWRRLAEVPEGAATLPWLYAVAYRILSHQWRGRDRGRRLIERLRGLAEPEITAPEVLLVANEEYRTVIRASATLRAVDQEILLLTVWEELSHADIAVVLGIEEGAVRQRAFRARHNLAVAYDRLTRDRIHPAARKGGGS